jgi:hypothetical protein
MKEYYLSKAIYCHKKRMVKDGNISDKRASAGLKEVKIIRKTLILLKQKSKQTLKMKMKMKMKIYYNNIYLKIL